MKQVDTYLTHKGNLNNLFTQQKNSSREANTLSFTIIIEGM